ncbi:Adenylate kinase 7 (AK 7) (ATP-AMP transphosphorylase 7) [Durusdinium trenchii]|uniref:Adenylate kinase 7 (AK 7) (ATP-AMP transphosphorylase 7) n=1 Tax=Durusdinium trenchii TaxID=1381693 RepID=A0ABP0IHW9_9DINO
MSPRASDGWAKGSGRQRALSRTATEALATVGLRKEWDESVRNFQKLHAVGFCGFEVAAEEIEAALDEESAVGSGGLAAFEHRGIFIHNVDSYIGRALVKELRKADGGLHRFFGTVKSGSSAPPAVKRVVCRDDPKKAKKMAETMQSCRLVVISLNDCSLEDLHFAITALKVDPKVTPPHVLGELESEVIFLVISSVMVWADTKPEAPGQAIKASDYLRRVPQAGSKFEQWKEMEDLVFRCFNREASQVKAFVVAGGLLYGEGEEIFAPAFQDARGVSDSMVDMSPGVNKVPRVHVRDLARLVRQVSLTAEGINPLEATPYFLAVDQPPSAVLQTDLVGIVDKVGEHYEVPRVDAEATPGSPDGAADG